MKSRAYSLLKQSLAGLFALAILPLCQTAAAESSTSAYSLVGVNNLDTYLYVIDGQYTDGSLASASAANSFTGMNGAGVNQTMTWTGNTIASSQFGRLRCYTDGTLTNSYYNIYNPAYVADQTATIINPNGSPSTLVSLGFAWFNDTLQFGGELQAGYKARYLFHVDGTNSGTGPFGALTFTIEGNDSENFFLFGDTINTTWATQDYEVNGITPQTVHVQFSTQVVFDLVHLTDGGNYTGISDFSSTASLEAIEMVDANDNPVYGWTVTSESGTVYPARNHDPATTSQISGTLVLEGILASASSQAIDFVFRPIDNSGDVTQTVNVQPNGVFTLSGMPRKNGTLHVKGTRYLARNVASDASNGDVSGVTATLRAGDANNDNAVDIGDLLLLIAHYNKVSPDVEYLDVADLNVDGANDISDLLLLIRNYNTLGDN